MSCLVYPHSDIAYESYLRIGKIYFYKLNNADESKKYFEKIVKEASMSRFSVEASEIRKNIY